MATPIGTTALEECDVAVIGGGPAGSTAAAMLARRGHRVIALEKARHPRFHIGESLLPANLPLFEKLGVAKEVEAIGIDKWGATFVSPYHDFKSGFEFGDAVDPTMPKAYEVRRSQLDEILFRNAARSGAGTGAQASGERAAGSARQFGSVLSTDANVSEIAPTSPAATMWSRRCSRNATRCTAPAGSRSIAASARPSLSPA